MEAVEEGKMVVNAEEVMMMDTRARKVLAYQGNLAVFGAVQTGPAREQTSPPHIGCRSLRFTFVT